MEKKTILEWAETYWNGEHEKDLFVRVEDIIKFLNQLDLDKFDSTTIMHISNSLLSQSSEVQDAKNN